MDRKRERTRFLVVRCDERIGAGRIEAFADSGGDGAEEQRPDETTDKPHSDRHERPCYQRNGDEPLARKPVSHESGDDRHRGKRPRKDGVDPADLYVGELEFGLDRNREKPEERAVGLMEKERAAQKRDENPFVHALLHAPSPPNAIISVISWTLRSRSYCPGSLASSPRTICASSLSCPA